MQEKESNCKKMKMFLPLRVANFLASILEKQAKKKGSRPLMTTFSVYNLARNNTFDSTKAKTELGYTARSYEETVKDQVAWLRKECKLNILLKVCDKNMPNCYNVIFTSSHQVQQAHQLYKKYI